MDKLAKMGGFDQPHQATAQQQSFLDDAFLYRKGKSAGRAADRAVLMDACNHSDSGNVKFLLNQPGPLQQACFRASLSRDSRFR